MIAPNDRERKSVIDTFLANPITGRRDKRYVKSTLILASVARGGQIMLGLVLTRRIKFAAPGYQDAVQWEEGGPKVGYNGYATRFRATQTLLDLCAQHGIAMEDVDRHFILPLPDQPLQLRARSARNGIGRRCAVS